jgi:hypothetical protein
MNRKTLFTPALVLLGWLCISCGDPQAGMGYIFPRTSIISQNSETADISVELEGLEGNLITGAVVLVHNNANGVLKCNYDGLSGSYTGEYPIPADGILNFSIKSALSSKTITYSVTHNQIISKPSVSVLEDSSGYSVLLGQALDFRQDVHIGWDTCGEDMLYQVTIKSAVKTFYEGSTNGLTLIIPGGTVNLSTGQIYYIQITAQCISGDPFFRSANYYSASIATGESLSFNVR